jgi:hypothetical protein
MDKQAAEWLTDLLAMSLQMAFNAKNRLSAIEAILSERDPQLLEEYRRKTLEDAAKESGQPPLLMFEALVKALRSNP